MNIDVTSKVLIFFGLYPGTIKVASG